MLGGPYFRMSGEKRDLGTARRFINMDIIRKVHLLRVFWKASSPRSEFNHSTGSNAEPKVESARSLQGIPKSFL